MKPTLTLVPRTPGDTSLDAPVLAAAPGLFALANLSSGAAAAVFRYIRHHRLYKAEGYRSMREYAAARLGVRTKSAYKKTAAAGENAWRYYKQQCWELLNQLAQGVTAVTPSFTKLPNEALLSALKRAVGGVEPDEQPKLLESVLSGDYRAEDLEKISRRQPPEVTPKQGTPNVPGPIKAALQKLAEAEAIILRRDLGSVSPESLGFIEQQLETLIAAVREHRAVLGMKVGELLELGVMAP